MPASRRLRSLLFCLLWLGGVLFAWLAPWTTEIFVPAVVVLIWSLATGLPALGWTDTARCETPATSPLRRACTTATGILLILLSPLAIHVETQYLQTLGSGIVTARAGTLRGVFRCVEIYASEHDGNLPAQWSDLVPSVLRSPQELESILNGPASGHPPGTFHLLHPGEKLNSLPADEPLITSTPVREVTRLTCSASGNITQEKSGPLRLLHWLAGKCPFFPVKAPTS